MALWRERLWWRIGDWPCRSITTTEKLQTRPWRNICWNHCYPKHKYLCLVLDEWLLVVLHESGHTCGQFCKCAAAGLGPGWTNKRQSHMAHPRGQSLLCCGRVRGEQLLLGICTQLPLSLAGDSLQGSLEQGRAGEGLQHVTWRGGSLS